MTDLEHVDKTIDPELKLTSEVLQQMERARMYRQGVREAIFRLAVTGRYSDLRREYPASEFGLTRTYMEEAVKDVRELFKKAGLAEYDE